MTRHNKPIWFFFVISLILSILAAMFEYVIWALFNRDLPWYLDFIGAVISGTILPPIWFVIYIMVNYLGYTSPIIH